MAIVELSIFQLVGITLFGFIFGIFETLTNLLYLVTKNYDLPRKQHGKELPVNVTDDQVFHKSLQMLCLGIFLLIISILSSAIAPQLFIIGGAAIFLSGLIDYSKFRKRDMFIVWIAISIIACVFSLITAV
ncbi:MAG: hypothetical protein JSW11_20030 [Candidatus Heimdallarchaeota archaeon]|nr:MAG: hypothetical protein JSW11_20030 [Candidatus Heimdallarchaeota archaeon]